MKLPFIPLFFLLLLYFILDATKPQDVGASGDDENAELLELVEGDHNFLSTKHHAGYASKTRNYSIIVVISIALPLIVAVLALAFDAVCSKMCCCT